MFLCVLSTPGVHERKRERLEAERDEEKRSEMDNIGGCEKEEEIINKIKDETKKRLGNMKKR